VDEEKHSRDADEKLHTAELDVAQSDEVLEHWQATFTETKKIIRRNGFGEALTAIMRAPARRGAA